MPLDGVFTYSVPTSLAEQVKIGVRVLVPFGRSKTYVGIIAKTHKGPLLSGMQIKDILQILDPSPILLDSQLRLWQWIADYYMSPIGEVYKAALPSGLKAEDGYRPKTETYIRLTHQFRSEQALHIAIDMLQRAPKQQKAFIDFLSSLQGNLLTPDSRLLSPSSEVETLLIQSIIRDGEKVIYEHVEADDGGFVDLTVAQYVDYDLGQDNIRFSNELYNQILEEAVAHSGEPDFKTETYFMHHPDVNISSLAARLAIDTHQLGKNFQVKEREGSLRQHVLHLVLDLRMDIVENRLKELKAEMRQVGNDMERIKALMEEFKDTQELRNALAQQLGNDVVNG